MKYSTYRIILSLIVLLSLIFNFIIEKNSIFSICIGLFLIFILQSRYIHQIAGVNMNYGNNKVQIILNVFQIITTVVLIYGMYHLFKRIW